MACKSATIIVITRVRAGLGLTAALSSGLVSSAPRRVLFSALNRVTDPGRSKAANMF